jgi:hypothetical protein
MADVESSRNICFMFVMALMIFQSARDSNTNCSQIGYKMLAACGMKSVLPEYEQDVRYHFSPTKGPQQRKSLPYSNKLTKAPEPDTILRNSPVPGVPASVTLVDIRYGPVRLLAELVRAR